MHGRLRKCWSWQTRTQRLNSSDSDLSGNATKIAHLGACPTASDSCVRRACTEASPLARRRGGIASAKSGVPRMNLGLANLHSIYIASRMIQVQFASARMDCERARDVLMHVVLPAAQRRGSFGR